MLGQKKKKPLQTSEGFPFWAAVGCGSSHCTAGTTLTRETNLKWPFSLHGLEPFVSPPPRAKPYMQFVNEVLFHIFDIKKQLGAPFPPIIARDWPEALAWQGFEQQQTGLGLQLPLSPKF